jgi:hypothetical protein
MPNTLTLEEPPPKKGIFDWVEWGSEAEFERASREWISRGYHVFKLAKKLATGRPASFPPFPMPESVTTAHVFEGVPRTFIQFMVAAPDSAYADKGIPR